MTVDDVIERVQLLEVKENQALLVKVKEVTPRLAEHIKDTIGRALPGIKVLVVEAGIDFFVVDSAGY